VHIVYRGSNQLDNSILGLIVCILTILLVIGIWAEIIGFIIHAVKNKELKNNGLWVALIYFFNIFIIPYYNLKYVFKEKKLKLKMTIFSVLIVSIIVIVSIVMTFTYNNYYRYNQYTKNSHL